MLIRPAAPRDLDAWAALRAALWPGDTIGDHRAELAEALASEGDSAAFVAEASDRLIVGFIEASLRHDYVNGCETSPVAFVEGLYVRPEFRKTGVGLALCDAVADWGRGRGCSELASDALADNLESHAFHQAIGFEETERVVYFRKPL
ncbi:N-acetyltransferase [Caulobacter segnis]|uniref:Aminoglycoside N(6')-acetyltransferase type 1 n=2 Tax=Caulobacter segnis TaxID=88688 RepID=D5VPN8_CAUST|nr:aminoglycoside 6'-N-acetyltransferase [Caulobacter segnis]ADG12461.1 GCN5-related N-acetyltransferase [Caulobacter segnis ATCC 21756]AVQ04046.1 N-acetyltransferase [Caulobacter segnis]